MGVDAEIDRKAPEVVWMFTVLASEKCRKRTNLPVVPKLAHGQVPNEAVGVGANTGAGHDGVPGKAGKRRRLDDDSAVRAALELAVRGEGDLLAGSSKGSLQVGIRIGRGR